MLSLLELPELLADAQPWALDDIPESETVEVIVAEAVLVMFDIPELQMLALMLPATLAQPDLEEVLVKLELLVMLSSLTSSNLWFLLLVLENWVTMQFFLLRNLFSFLNLFCKMID